MANGAVKKIFLLDQDLSYTLRQVAFATGRSQSDLVREALRHYFATERRNLKGQERSRKAAHHA